MLSPTIERIRYDYKVKVDYESKLLSYFPPQRFGRVPSSPYDKKERNLAENGESLSL